MILSIIPTGPVRPGVVGKPLRRLQISASRVPPSRCVAPASSGVVRPLAGSVGVSVLVSEGEPVVTPATTSICKSTAESVVVVAVVVLSIVVLSVVVAIVVLAVVVLAVIVLAVVVAVVVAIVVAIVLAVVVTATSTVVGSPPKEEPFIPSVLPLHRLPSPPASVASAGSPTREEEPGLAILGLAFATFPARVAIIEVAVVEGTANCRTKDSSTKSSQASAHQTPVQGVVAGEKPRVCVQGTQRELLRRRRRRGRSRTTKVCLSQGKRADGNQH